MQSMQSQSASQVLVATAEFNNGFLHCNYRLLLGWYGGRLCLVWQTYYYIDLLLTPSTSDHQYGSDDQRPSGRAYPAGSGTGDDTRPSLFRTAGTLIPWTFIPKFTLNPSLATGPSVSQ